MPTDDPKSSAPGLPSATDKDKQAALKAPVIDEKNRPHSMKTPEIRRDEETEGAPPNPNQVAARDPKIAGPIAPIDTSGPVRDLPPEPIPDEDKVREPIPNHILLSKNFENMPLREDQLTGIQMRLRSGQATQEDKKHLDAILGWLVRTLGDAGGDGKGVTIHADAGHDDEGRRFNERTGGPSDAVSPRVASHDGGGQL